MKAIDMAPIQRKYKGYYVALRHTQHAVTVVGKGRTISEALDDARQHGARDPAIMRVPEENYSYIL